MSAWNILFPILIILCFTLLPRLIKTARRRNAAGKRMRRKSIMPDFRAPVPNGLGVRSNYATASKLVNHLEEAFDDSFRHKLRHRLIFTSKLMTPDEFEWFFFEMKRYFVISAVLRNAAMFSARVDDVWHEMLMFTSEYQDFCQRFLGTMIHHVPNLDSSPIPGQRALFDWVYGQLFEIPETSWRIWGDFYRQPLDEQLVQKLKQSTGHYLFEDVFNYDVAETCSAAREVIDSLVEALQAQLDKAFRYQSERRSRNECLNAFAPGTGSGFGDLSMMTGALVMFSVMDFGGFGNDIQAIAPDGLYDSRDRLGGWFGGTNGGASSSCNSSGGSCSSSNCSVSNCASSGCSSSGGCSSASCGGGGCGSGT